MELNLPPEGVTPILKPDGNDVEQMVRSNPHIFDAGRHPLPAGDHPLAVEKIIAMHMMHCQLCSTHSHTNVHQDCYFALMIPTIINGWRPPIDETKIRRKYATSGNYPSTRMFPNSVHQEITDMISQGVLRPAQPTPGAITNPIGAQVKNSDKIRSKVLAGVDIVDQATMDNASKRLTAMGHSKVKCRLTLDPTATGVNDASPNAPFRYPSLHDMLDLVQRDWVLALTDISRYFHTFPLSKESRKYFRVWYGDQLLEYARCPFGYKLCPYFCSTWSAEFKRWFRAMGIQTAHMVDDWLTTAPHRDAAIKSIKGMESMLTETGFGLSDKSKLGTTEVLLGVMVDTTSMTLRFDPTQCRGVKQTLLVLRATIQRNQNPDHTIVRHICGKLNWFSEILQSGRLRLSQWWKYCHHGIGTPGASKVSLLDDTDWWIAILSSWETGSSSTLSYPIINPSSLIHSPRSVYLVQSDASGTDGFGYFSAHLEDNIAKFHSTSWPSNEQIPSSSNACELTALSHAIKHLPQHPTPQLVIWITDSLSASFSINKGISRKDQSFHIVDTILRDCDDKRTIIVALWVPREQNHFADLLSHLAHLLNRAGVNGTFNLESPPGIEELQQVCSATRPMVPSMVPR